MDFNELVKKATLHGNSLGQIALCEFILKSYREELPPNLISLLEKILQVEYESVGREFDKPAEDVALVVSEILEKH